MNRICNLIAAFILWLLRPVPQREDLDGGSDEWMRDRRSFRDWEGP